MKKWLALLILAACSLVIFSPRVLAQDTQNFTFDSFDADYYVRRDTTNKSPVMIVNEKLVARFPNYDQNHGILRAIPKRYQDHTLSLKILSVTDENGQPYKYTQSDQNDNDVLKIGDASTYVHGQKTYKINYELRNYINYQPDGDEFYWDVNGNQWSQSFVKVTARIHVPADLAPALQARQVCYLGVMGSQASRCTVDRQSAVDGTLVTSSADLVNPFETLTFAVAFNKGTFAPGPEIAAEKNQRNLYIRLFAIMATAPVAIAGWLMIKRWREFGNDPKGRGVIIPEYSQPKGFDVLDSDFILNQRMGTTAFSAMLIEQAIAKNLTIIEVPKKGIFGSKDYQLQLLRAPTNVSAEVTSGLELVFGPAMKPDTRVSMNDFKKSPSLRQDLRSGLKDIEKKLAERQTKQGYFVKDPLKIKSSYRLWALAPAAVGFGVIGITAGLSFWPITGLGAGLIMAAVVMLLFAGLMPARTQTGVQLHDDLLGLKEYIKMAEADRLKYLQSPEGAEKIADKAGFNPKTDAAKVKLFEKLLPYAMLFGQEKGWANQFKDIYRQPPDWYQGNWTAFNAGYLAGSLGDFNSSASQAFAAPSSSSGSGFGGGAGGGGGGGGGGGW